MHNEGFVIKVHALLMMQGNYYLALLNMYKLVPKLNLEKYFQMKAIVH